MKKLLLATILAIPAIGYCGFTDKDNEVAFANKGLYDDPNIASALRVQKLDKVFIILTVV
ncbi:hypothetical protein [Francisella tularensis]|uniref:hypothetical protein n=1 Tax=Francisella tularensis TaxID=263 RepID=UPI001C0EB33C|nr:hypothetical protein [Francisella tularensis]MBK2110176.1 hypothetical protein [Francisella tularensis subsp. novicida FSC595]